MLFPYYYFVLDSSWANIHKPLLYPNFLDYTLDYLWIIQMLISFLDSILVSIFALQ